MIRGSDKREFFFFTLCFAPLHTMRAVSFLSRCLLFVFLSIPFLLAETRQEEEQGDETLNSVAPAMFGIKHVFYHPKFYVRSPKEPPLFYITAQEYSPFLNAVAAADVHGCYNEKLADGLMERSRDPGFYCYSTVSGAKKRPVCFVSQNTAAHYCNWVENGCPAQEQDAEAMDYGVYQFEGDHVIDITSEASHVLFLSSDRPRINLENCDSELESNHLGFSVTTRTLSPQEKVPEGTSFETIAGVTLFLVGVATVAYGVREMNCCRNESDGPVVEERRVANSTVPEERKPAVVPLKKEPLPRVGLTQEEQTEWQQKMEAWEKRREFGSLKKNNVTLYSDETVLTHVLEGLTQSPSVDSITYLSEISHSGSEHSLVSGDGAWSDEQEVPSIHNSAGHSSLNNARIEESFFRSEDAINAAIREVALVQLKATIQRVVHPAIDSAERDIALLYQQQQVMRSESASVDAMKKSQVFRSSSDGDRNTDILTNPSNSVRSVVEVEGNSEVKKKKKSLSSHLAKLMRRMTGMPKTSSNKVN